jgi:hypothetical protein
MDDYTNAVVIVIIFGVGFGLLLQGLQQRFDLSVQ